MGEAINIRTYILTLLLIVAVVQVYSLDNREEFTTPILRLAIKNDRENEGSKVVYIYSDDYEQYSIIGFINDIEVVNKKGAIYKTLYTESSSTSYTLSKFERKNLKDVISSLEKTLKVLNSNLDKKNFDRCRYLDGYFPKFLKGFYKLSSLTFASSTALPEVANIDESLYDVSLSSPKTDKRIADWQRDKEYIVKLRISIRELLFQIKKWEKNLVLDPHIKNAAIGYSKEFNMAYELFVKMYFNID